MREELKIKINIARLQDSSGIHNALKKNLMEIRNVDKITKKQRLELEDKGFLRKEVEIEYYINLINDPYTDIYVAKNTEGTIIGFATVHKKKYNISKVRDLIGNLTFENEKTRDLLVNEEVEFTYLDQISIFPEYKRKGIGTAIFQKALKTIDTPIVAFIVEKPLFNKASVNWHEKNGFKFSAISEGKYKGKPFKFRIFIHWNEKNH